MEQKGVCVVAAISTDGWEKMQNNELGLMHFFEVVRVDELSEKDTGAVLAGLKESFEEFHGILLSEEACQAKDLAGPCGEVWWLNSIGEKVYRTWPANSECYRETRTGYDLLDSCRN